MIKFITYFCVALAVLTVFHSAYISYERAVQEYKEIQAIEAEEQACVNKLIAQGVERIDIYTGDGICYTTPNGYYK